MKKKVEMYGVMNVSCRSAPFTANTQTATIYDEYCNIGVETRH